MDLVAATTVTVPTTVIGSSEARNISTGKMEDWDDELGTWASEDPQGLLCVSSSSLSSPPRERDEESEKANE
ncbi:hypothetical protein KPH14_007993 [Odynerus spinipes]|uniref:Uncharacterized protein n=1 Tax=Odynerus spinipes TaxID=1348599 RepID=A0AAD9VNF1_9HYME|nr:hypothetical protein KPH14_007993 [Odynerus spinipes]